MKLFKSGFGAIMFVMFSMLMVIGCTTTNTFEKVITANSIVEVNKRFDSVKSVALALATKEQAEKIQDIVAFKLALESVIEGEGVDDLQRASLAAQIELYYAKAKVSYIEVREEINLDSLNPNQQWEMKRFDSLVTMLDRRLGNLSKEEKYTERKALVYEMLEMLISTMQMVQFSRV